MAFSALGGEGSRAFAAAILSGAILFAIAVAADEPVGSSVRFNREIVRIFERKCVVCHDRDDSIPLVTYQEVRPWARAIREEILERRMPPWGAAHGVKPLANDISLTIREITIIASWADGGTPRGDPRDLPAPEPEPRWRAGKPSRQLEVPTQTFVADGALHVRRVTLHAASKAAWLRGFDLEPGAGSAVRAAFLSLEGDASDPQWLGGWAPWYSMSRISAEAAHRLPAGANLTLELHYADWGDGETRQDDSTVGLYLSEEPPASIARSLEIAASLEPGDSPRYRGRARLVADSALLAFRPWLKRNGQPIDGSIEVSAVTPDGAVEALLWVPRLQAHWRTPYVLKEPARLPRGSRLVVTAYPGETAQAAVIAGVSISLYDDGGKGARGVAGATAGRER